MDFVFDWGETVATETKSSLEAVILLVNVTAAERFNSRGTGDQKGAAEDTDSVRLQSQAQQDVNCGRHEIYWPR